MTLNPKETELLNFIEKKKNLPKNIDLKNIFFIFLKVQCNSLFNSYINLKNVDYSLSCLDMIFSIFWIIYNYTYNLKLSMFLSERGVILFTEYINLSNNIQSLDKINLIDVKLFIFKKTLGPIILKNINNNNKNISKLNNLFILSNKIKDFITSIFIKYYKIDNLSKNLEFICTTLGNILFKVNEINGIYIEDFILIKQNEKIINLSSFITEILEIKIKLEIFFIIYKNYKNIEKIINQLENIDINLPSEYLDITKKEKIVDTKYFKELLKKFKNKIN